MTMPRMKEGGRYVVGGAPTTSVPMAGSKGVPGREVHTGGHQDEPPRIPGAGKL